MFLLLLGAGEAWGAGNGSLGFAKSRGGEHIRGDEGELRGQKGMRGEGRGVCEPKCIPMGPKGLPSIVAGIPPHFVPSQSSWHFLQQGETPLRLTNMSV